MAQGGRYVRLIVEREGALGAFASVPGTAHAWHDRPASRRMGFRQTDRSSGALVGRCDDRSRNFNLSPCLAALVWAESLPR